MSESLFSAVELATPGRVGFRLQRVELYNWGTFDGQVHRLAVSGETALLTGDIGSGKSTLVDAVTTLLLPAHRITYNKAAGAGARERSLRSYVGGYYKSERTETTGRSRPIGLRSGDSYSVILGIFANEGFDETVTLAQVFQQRDIAGQPYRFFAIASRDLTIADDFANFGATLNDLRKRLRSSDVTVYDDYPPYGKSLQRLLEIRSAQALELFGQTVSMKSVGNLDDFVRAHMLEPSDSGERVRQIVSHFEDLTHAYDAVTRAREQLGMLEPLVATAERYDAATDARAARGTERDAVSPFIKELRRELLVAEIAALESTQRQRDAEQGRIKAREREVSQRRDGLIAERAGAGGDRIAELGRLADEAREQASDRRASRAAFDADIATAGLEAVTGPAAFDEAVARSAALRPDIAARQQALSTEIAEVIGAEKAAQARAAALDEEIASLTARENNIPLGQITIRAQLCDVLGIDPTEVPFAGELLDVAADHDEWRGAVERVLRSFALSLLIPQRHYAAVSDWVDGRRLRTVGPGGRQVGARLVYLRVPDRRLPVRPVEHSGLILADCLDIRPGPFADYIGAEVATRADHVCATTTAQFRSESRAVTVAGQVRSGDRHEKDDRFAADDPRHWVLGWANERKIAALTAERAEAAAEEHAAHAGWAQLDADRAVLQQRHDALVRLATYRSWTDLDADEARLRAKRHTEERDRILAGSARLADIESALARVVAEAADLDEALREITGALATGARDIAERHDSLAEDEERLAALSAEEWARARSSYPAMEKRIGTRRPTDARACRELESALVRELHDEIERLGDEQQKSANDLTRQMTAFLGKWPELRADMDTAVDARADFLSLRDRLLDDDLPRFVQTFKDQLNTNAIQELAAFNNWLGRQAEAIDERVARINEALAAVPYNPGRYIRLEKQPTVNHDVLDFRRDLRNLTDDTLVPDGDTYSEARFEDVKRIIERLRGREGYAETDRTWTRRVTDVRNWFIFSASERDRETDAEWEHYSDSDGKSGGQKEKLAYTILAASLAYQFGLEWGVSVARDFRFAVIDEAFGRGSDASTRYALELFAKLGLQLLVVTPLQKVHVIEPFVRAIGFVDNPTGTSSRVHTMTIEQYHEGRAGRS